MANQPRHVRRTSGDNAQDLQRLGLGVRVRDTRPRRRALDYHRRHDRGLAADHAGFLTKPYPNPISLASSACASGRRPWRLRARLRR